MKTDHWFYGLFQSAPDLIALLLPAAGAAGASAGPSLGPDSPGDVLYRFGAPELKAVNHRLDGVFWPRSGEAGMPDQPVVLLEVQMHAKSGFKHRLWAQTARFVQLHPQVQHLAVVVVMPHRRLNLGPAQLPQQLQSFLDGVHWLSLEELGQQTEHKPILTLLTPCQCCPSPTSLAPPNRSWSPGPICLTPFSLSWDSGFPISLARKSWP